ncbi:CLIP-associating protein 1-A-like isoform X13 [Lytechinus variegatus]|uniref:CLIP-associating protein 1-A-like isoform X13 n=1 Tax=Lytechinus variegatus TaxID=7654 RepID=UPI001BB24FFA|nr:CLIP-associating protein 1-A-like isoform X13 [Lytechinus variegatus]
MFMNTVHNDTVHSAQIILYIIHVGLQYSSMVSQFSFMFYCFGISTICLFILQFVFERLMKAFSHKGWRVREEVLLCLMQAINVFGASSLLLNKIVPSICKLLGDPNSQVRDTAINTLVEIYRHVGEKVRIDLGKKGIPSSRLSIIYAKFDDVKRSGQMVVQSEQSAPAKTSASQDETDSKPSKKSRHSKIDTSTSSWNAKAKSAVAKKVAMRAAAEAAVQKTAPAKRPAASTTQRKSISRPSTGSSSGAVDENFFQAAYEDVPSVSIFTTKQLEDDLSKMSTILSNDKADWELRVTALKKLRAFIIAGAAEYDCFGQSLRQMEEALILSVKDLRSQVLREACVTLAFLSIRLKRQFDHAAEVVLPHLFILIQNSAKVMATSSMVAIDVIIRHTHSPRLIPIMKSNATSKSTAIRKQTFTYISTVLNVWDTHAMERHASLLCEVIHKGIEDADSEARAVSRKAFWKFSEHFKSHADKMFNNLDASKQKMLQGELSQASSCTSLDGRPLSRSSTASSHENLRTASLPRRSVASRASRTSDSSATPRGSSLLQTPNGRAGRTRSRIGVSQSQPGSRSNSRSSSPSTASSRYSNIQTNGRTRRKSGIPVPRSQGASREASPNRYGYASARERRQSGSSLGPAQREPKEKQNIMAQRVLVPGQDAEAALADALISAQRALRSNYGYGYDSDYSDNLTQKVMQRKRYENFSDDESDASSVCSVGSYGSGPAKIIEDVSEVLNKMASPAWSERKEGLIGLQYTLHSNRALSRSEIKRITELFTRMFADPQSKTFSLFLETLGEFIIVHKTELLDWLFVLITRLLQKMGSDLLGSILNKIQRTLEIVRESFPYEIQFRILTKYIMDQTQTPNMKTKVAMLRYMESLTDVMDPADFSNSAETRLAVSRIIGWTKEAKSPEVRRASQAVLIALFELNTPEFSMMLSVLPKTYQPSGPWNYLVPNSPNQTPGSMEGATKLLRNDLRIASTIDDEITAQEYRSKASPRSALKASPRSTGSSPRGSYASNGPPDTEFLNSEDIYDSLRRTTAEIQNYMHSSRDDLDHVAVSKETRVDSDEGIADTMGRMTLTDGNYEDETFHEDHQDILVPLLTELSNHNGRFEERKNAMMQLIRLTRSESLSLWDDHFKTVLLLMLETLGDVESSIRAMALRVLREILRNQPGRFKDYAELTILKILEAHRDPHSEVVRQAEETSATLAISIAPSQCVRVLCPIIQTADCPINQAAIKMLTKIVELMSEADLMEILPEVIAVLLKSYDHTESSVRKASVFCLVAIHNIIGDKLKEKLADLPGCKMKLLNLYIKRAQAEKDAQTPSPSSPSALSTGSR